MYKYYKAKFDYYHLQDKTCIVWDLSKLTYVRQLSQHMAPITAIAINDLTVSYYVTVLSPFQIAVTQGF